jgi:hypothetical protein
MKRARESQKVQKSPVLFRPYGLKPYVLQYNGKTSLCFPEDVIQHLEDELGLPGKSLGEAIHHQWVNSDRKPCPTTDWRSQAAFIIRDLIFMILDGTSSKSVELLERTDGGSMWISKEGVLLCEIPSKLLKAQEYYDELPTRGLVPGRLPEQSFWQTVKALLDVLESNKVSITTFPSSKETTQELDPVPA